MTQSITLVKGPNATGRAFEFRITDDKDSDKKDGKLVIGDKPVKVPLGTAEARKANLATNVQRLITRGYVVEFGKVKAKTDGADTTATDDH